MKTNYLHSIPVEWADTARIFTALGDQHRQRILLLFEPGERLTISDIVGVSNLSRTAVNHHLKILREARLLLAEKVGKEVFLRVNTALLLDTFDLMTTYVRQQQEQTK